MLESILDSNLLINKYTWLFLGQTHGIGVTAICEFSDEDTISYDAHVHTLSWMY